MKMLVGLFLLLSSNLALANVFVCKAEKSVMTFNSETDEVKVRRAVSPQFSVTSAEHEDPKTLNLTDEAGLSWGSVKVVTGSHSTDNEKWFYANAMVTKAEGTIIAYVTLRMPVSDTNSNASTLIFDEVEQMPPTLTLSCSRAR